MGRENMIDEPTVDMEAAGQAHQTKNSSKNFPLLLLLYTNVGQI